MPSPTESSVHAPASTGTEHATASAGERGIASPKLLFVGAFPPPGRTVFGGNVTDCKLLLASSFPRRVDVLPLDTTQRSVPPPPLGRRLIDALARAREFVRLIGRERPDATLLFASAGFSFIEKGLLAAYARWRGVPSILAVRSGLFMETCRRSPLFRRVASVLLRAPEYVVCQGVSWQRFYEELFGMTAAQCPVVDSWVATPDLLRIGRQRSYLEDGTIRLLFVGWIERGKGVFELLEAVEQLIASGRASIALTIAGRGSVLEEACEWVHDHTLGEYVTFAGWVDGDAKHALFESADIFVLPSYAEGLPNAMIEAMAAGLPVVVTPVGSVPDVIQHDITGVLVAPRNKESLAGAIAGLVDSREARTRLGRAAFGLAQERFDVERAAASLADLVAAAARQGNGRCR